MPFSNYNNSIAKTQLLDSLTWFGNKLFRFGGMEVFSSNNYSFRYHLGPRNPTTYLMKAGIFCMSYIWACGANQSAKEIREEIRADLFTPPNRVLFAHKVRK